MKDEIIIKLTELLIKQDMKDKKKGKPTYVKKVDCYKDLINFFKKYDVLKQKEVNIVETEEYYGGTYPDPPEEENFVDEEDEDFDRDVYNEMKEVN